MEVLTFLESGTQSVIEELLQLLHELEKRNDGEVQIIDVKLNSRKTKTANNKKLETSLEEPNTKNASGTSSIVTDKINNIEKLQSLKDVNDEEMALINLDYIYLDELGYTTRLN